MQFPFSFPLIRGIIVTICAVTLLIYIFLEKILSNYFSFIFSFIIAGGVSVLIFSFSLILVFKWMEKHLWKIVLAQEKYEQTLVLFQKSNEELEKKNYLLEEKIREIKTLGKITKAISTTIELKEILRVILMAVINNLKFDQALIMLINKNKKILEVKETQGVNSDKFSQLKIPLSKENIPIVRVVLDRRPRIISWSSYYEDIFTKRKDSIPEDVYSIHTLIKGTSELVAAVPLITKDKVSGVLVVCNLNSKRKIEEKDIRNLMTYTHQAGIAIENARLYETEKKFNEKLRKEIEIAKEELEKAQEELIRKEKLAAMGTMGATVAHEVRNPMSSIRASAQRIGKMIDKRNPLNKYSEYIMKEVDRLERIVKEMLVFSRTPTPHFEPEDLNKVIKENLISMEDEVKKNGIEIIKKFSPLPLIKLDKGLIRQVILNIVQNSLYFMKEKTVRRIIIDTFKEGKYVVVMFKDTGPGIKKEIINKIFDPFFSTRPQGTGLGLSVCQRIIESHKGKIEVESQEDKGTIFKIKLPIKLS